MALKIFGGSFQVDRVIKSVEAQLESLAHLPYEIYFPQSESVIHKLRRDLLNVRKIIQIKTA